MSRRQSETQMVRLDRDTVKRLKQLQEQLGDTEGVHQYLLRDWHGKLQLSLDAVIQVLLDRNDDHLRRSRNSR